MFSKLYLVRCSAFLVLLGWAAFALLATPGESQSAAKDAVVRVFSHGISATVVYTEPGKSLLLGCAHGYKGNDRYKRMLIDVPAPVAGNRQTGGIKVIKLDYRMDLSLVEVGIGPLPYVCPIATKTSTSRNCLSVGYDGMKITQTVRTATIVAQTPLVTYTREIPWHGRSGGALINERGELIGVVQGYEVNGRGMYVSHEAILRFVGWKRLDLTPRGIGMDMGIDHRGTNPGYEDSYPPGLFLPEERGNRIGREDYCLPHQPFA